MIDRSKKLPAFFYETSNGNQSGARVDTGAFAGRRETDWAGPSEGRVRLADWHALLPQSRQRPVGGAHRSDGWKDRRIVFCVSQERMVLLHGFIKKTQKTPAQGLKLALKRIKDVI